jgi:hypothetical protein
MTPLAFPDFHALHRRKSGTHCLWAFDLVELGSRNLCGEQLVDRQRGWQPSSSEGEMWCQVLRFSEPFDEANKQLKAVGDLHRLEAQK